MVSSYTHFYLLHNYTAVWNKIIFNSNQNLKKNTTGKLIWQIVLYELSSLLYMSLIFKVNPK